MKRKIDFLDFMDFITSIKVLYVVIILNITYVYFAENEIIQKDINNQIKIQNLQSKSLNLQIDNLYSGTMNLKIESGKIYDLLKNKVDEDDFGSDSLDIKLVERIKSNFNKEYDKMINELELIEINQDLLKVNEDRLKMMIAKNKSSFWYLICLIIAISIIYRETIK